MKHSDLITFKTEYINEIPLYDFVNSSLLKTSNDSKIILKKFTTKGFNIKR